MESLSSRFSPPARDGAFPDRWWWWVVIILIVVIVVGLVVIVVGLVVGGGAGGGGGIVVVVVAAQCSRGPDNQPLQPLPRPRGGWLEP